MEGERSMQGAVVACSQRGLARLFCRTCVCACLLLQERPDVNLAGVVAIIQATSAIPKVRGGVPPSRSRP